MYKIYHNPQCSKSREVLEMLEKTGKAVEIVEYQKVGIKKSEIKKILELLDVPAMKIIRTKNQDWEIGDAHKKSSQKTLIRFIHEHPRCLQRPIVMKNERQAVIGRPASNVKELL